MALKWKLRLYYAGLLLLLLGLLATATAAIVLRDFRMQLERREIEERRSAQQAVSERLAAIDSAVARAFADPLFQSLVRRDLETTRDRTMPEWVPLAGRLAARHGLPLLKILDAEGIVLSSAHWPASYNLRDSPGLILALESESGARLVRERIADARFLALMAPRWTRNPRRYVIVGGARADSVLEAAIAERSGVGVRFAWFESQDGAPPGTDLAWIALPTSPSEARGGLALDLDRSALADLKRRLAQIFGLATLAGMLFAWLVGLWVSSRVTQPLEQLARGVTLLASGGKPPPVAVQGSTEVRALVRSFNQLAQNLEESHQALRRAERVAAWRDVARRIAHEIKNALVPIQLSVESVARSVHTGRGDLSELTEESVRMVRGEIESLTRLVNAFNEFARLPLPERRPHPMSRTWEDAVAAFRERVAIEARGLDVLPELDYDDEQIRRALHNLVRNAVEAGATRLELTVTSGERGWRVRLVDDGPGIAADDLPHVFEPYFTRKEAGTGLGLAIVYKIIVDHGWSIAVESPLHPEASARRGTAFTITIPAATPRLHPHAEEIPRAG